MAGIQEVARKAGVSQSTVSYVLSGRRPISDSTRERVLKAIDELNYRPHAGARALASSQMRSARKSASAGLRWKAGSNHRPS